MARKHEEQQPLTAGAANGSETAASSPPNEAAAVRRYGAPDATAAAAAGPGPGAPGAVETAANGARNGLHDVYGEEEEVEAGYGGLLSGDLSNGSGAAGYGTNGDAARAYKGEARAHPPVYLFGELIESFADYQHTPVGTEGRDVCPAACRPPCCHVVRSADDTEVELAADASGSPSRHVREHALSSRTKTASCARQYN